MKDNVTIPLGSIVMTRQIENHFGLYHHLFHGIEGKAKDFIPLTKLLIANKLAHTVAIHQIQNTYPLEFMEHLGITDKPSERTLYRTLERIGENLPVILDRYQQFIKKHDLVDKKQIVDFSSTYFEGIKMGLAKYGFSSDKRPDKLQIKFGIATGITGIPTALTIQKGNVQDKKHMKKILKLLAKILPRDSLLIFDTGANTKTNREKIRHGLRFHFLTLKPKKVGPYTAYIRFFFEQVKAGNVICITIEEQPYFCVKKQENDGSFSYIFFSQELYETQMKRKKKTFIRQKRKGNKQLRKRKHTIFPSDQGWVELIPSLQKTLQDIENPYINGLEGFFILESSVDEQPEKILYLYKQRDKAEKFIRALKEGLELRPIRHWKTECVFGIIFISFLANLLVSLTHFLKNISPVKNVKLLKKYLINLTETIVYPQNRFKFTILSNVSSEIRGLFGDFVWKFEDTSLNLRW